MRKGAATGGEGVRYVLAIAGCPGSGKSTLAKRLCSKINCRAEDQQAIATVVPMDGFHYTRAELDQMHRPELAHKRRGSHWTFDSEAFVESVIDITEPGSEASFPSFDHAIGDPVPEAIRVESHHQIVIVEGLYLLLDVPPWNDLYAHFDKRCFIKCPIGLALQRVMHRKVKTLGENPVQAKAQVDFNDKKNAITVWKTRKRADLMIPT
ncbi:uridine kinase [Chloropicon primus]|uniref:Uridine kinase n=2 Tax=Chloropicon primus TaxID=1764295 RepID=A0A5B8MR01_9CHLO|nr:uridine kinase [Chloropicon primus]UPR02077.1 uridine kinase [Chloropicon primus]|eukprot:QDZ22853.1 uridine kinase [Chloropicon primus]